MKVRPLLLLGDGHFAVETLEIAEAIGDFSPLGFVNSLTRPKPGATIEGLPGNVEIGDGAFIAQGAVIRERMKIGSGAVVGAGAVVLQDVNANDMVAGIPARVTRSDVNGH